MLSLGLGEARGSGTEADTEEYQYTVCIRRGRY